MLNIKKLLLIIFCMLLHVSYLSGQTSVPEKERYILLWDVSGSLLSSKSDDKHPSVDKYTGQNLKAKSGNGLWMSLKNALIESIESIEINEQSEIIVIPFYAEPLDEWREKASVDGKARIINKIMQYQYSSKVEQRTDLLKALERFEEIVMEDCLDYVNIMYFYTDGAHESIKDKPEYDCTKVIKQINDFNDDAAKPGRYIYRFYYNIALQEVYKKIKEQESDTKKFWVVDSLVTIKFIGLETLVVNYNVSDNYSKNTPKDTEKIINLTKDYDSYNGKIVFTPQESGYYNVDCKVSDGSSSVKIIVTPKEDVVNLPKREEITVKCKLKPNHDQKYYYLLDNEFKIICINTPERGVSLSLKNIEQDMSAKRKPLHLGNTSYYPQFMGNSSKLECLDFSLLTEFDKFAVQDKATLKVSFVDSKGEPLLYEDFRIVVNKVDTLAAAKDYCLVHSERTQVDFTIVPSKAADDFSFKGYLLVSQMNNIDKINGEAICNDTIKILPWKFEHDKKLNPLLKNILWVIFFICLILFIIWLLFFLRRWFAPHFPSGCKIAFAPGQYFTASEDHNFELSFKRIDEGMLVGDINVPNATSNIINTNILRESYIQKIVLSSSEQTTVQTGIQEKWNGRIIYVKADFHSNLISYIELIPIRVNLNKNDVKVLVKYFDKKDPDSMGLVGLDQLTNSHTETKGISINHTNVDVKGRRVVIFNINNTKN